VLKSPLFSPLKFLSASKLADIIGKKDQNEKLELAAVEEFVEKERKQDRIEGGSSGRVQEQKGNRVGKED
jgi:hypothetical protein